MVKIRLSKEAPWEKVKLSESFTISKTEWVDDYNESALIPIKKWIEQYIEPIEEPTKEEPVIDYTSVSKVELRLFCKQNNINYEDSESREQLLKKVELFNNPIIEEVKPVKSKRKKKEDIVLDTPTV